MKVMKISCSMGFLPLCYYLFISLCLKAKALHNVAQETKTYRIL